MGAYSDPLMGLTVFLKNTMIAVLREEKTIHANPFSFALSTVSLLFCLADSFSFAFFFLSFYFRFPPSLFRSVSFALSLSLSLGGSFAGCAEGDPVLSEGQAANHRSGGEHEWLRLSFMQGH